MNHHANAQAHNTYPQMNADIRRWDVNECTPEPVATTHKHPQHKKHAAPLNAYSFICVNLRQSADSHSSITTHEVAHLFYPSITPPLKRSQS
jgi:hypothetical protein